jgi:hypothetical protein
MNTHVDVERQSGNEIEITPEMIEAGVDAYYEANFDPGSPFSLQETVECIYRAMYAHSGTINPIKDQAAHEA